MKYLCLLSALLALGALVRGTEFQPGKLLASDDFDHDLTQWVVEQGPHGTTQIKSGQLEIDDGAGPNDKGGCTVWFRQKLTAPVLIEYEATLIEAGGPNDRVSDLNCFWMATDPRHPDDIFAGSAARGGNFANYDNLRLYYVGYGANDNRTTRFRRYPGDGTRPLDPTRGELLEPKFMNVANRPVRIQLIACDGRVQFLRDGVLVFDFRDPAPYREGWFGLRTVRNHMKVDKFRVYQLDPAPTRAP